MIKLMAIISLHQQQKVWSGNSSQVPLNLIEKFEINSQNSQNVLLLTAVVAIHSWPTVRFRPFVKSGNICRWHWAWRRRQTCDHSLPDAFTIFFFLAISRFALQLRKRLAQRHLAAWYADHHSRTFFSLKKKSFKIKILRIKFGSTRDGADYWHSFEIRFVAHVTSDRNQWFPHLYNSTEYLNLVNVTQNEKKRDNKQENGRQTVSFFGNQRVCAGLFLSGPKYWSDSLGFV